MKSLFALHAAEIAEAGLGADWEDFRRALSRLRRAGACVTRGELDAGRIGIAAPVFDRERAILGSLSLVLPAARADEGVIARLQALTVAGAREIERAMANGSVSRQPSPARMKVAR